MKAISIKPLIYFLFSLVIVYFTSISYGNDGLSVDEIMIKARGHYEQEVYQQAMYWYLKRAFIPCPLFHTHHL